MASYFDHFIVTKIFNSYLTDSFFILLFVIILFMVLGKNFFIIPNRFQSILEIIIDHWVTVVRENLGEKTDYYILPLTGLFMFILGINLLGFFLYTFPSTTHISLTFGAALSV